jgi:DNA-binding CsgD family transcriptional regulator
VSAIQNVSTAKREVTRTDFHDHLADFARRVEELRTPDAVLAELHGLSTKSAPLCVLGAARFPVKSGDWDAVQLGKSLFIHNDAPEGWWQEYETLARGRFRPLLFLARSSLAPYTWTEVRRMLNPIGTDQTVYELALKYGMRDGLTCPVGGRWAVVFWSPKVLCKILTQPMRVMILASASLAALRLEQIAGADANLVGWRKRLTPRELAVLRQASMGAQSHDIAKALGLGEETVRSHLKKAQDKLGARNRVHAVAEALRQNLIP